MNLDRVTITGADDSVDPAWLLGLSDKYPYVEWGILVSKSREGLPRFPPREWIARLQALAAREPHRPALSLHVCGRWTRHLLLGVNELPTGMIDGFQRVQLNFHAERTSCNAEAFAVELYKLAPCPRAVYESLTPQRQFIFQIDGALGNKHLEALWGSSYGNEHPVDAVPLFDVSGGAGIVPTEWPKPQYHADDESYVYHGYAGGLGPENLEVELARIGEAAGDTQIWVDMETRVRSQNNRLFDLELTERALQIAQSFIRIRG